ncbi:MAG: TonB-dependent receptor [Prevotellaceae bacterium]|jgi:TonB-linked SusC/RagA family outer membrane protein|nr:TonB-dependent receptor [Prevotellaceae bacterium]
MKKILSIAFLTLLSMGVMSGQTKVTGKVTDLNTNDPVSYASVAVKGYATAGTFTDDNGNYTINMPEGSITLVFSFVGYKTQEVVVNNRSIIDVSLEPDVAQIEESFVVAYGTATKGKYSGAAAVIKADKIQDIPVVSFEQALAGNTPGIQINSTSGLPGSFPEIRIRGAGSMNAGNNPLYIIDGVPAISGDLSTSNTTTSSMNFLNPSDIESITILKDAAAASLYGSRAANGVVLVTTKKGKAGKTQFRFKADLGLSDFAFNNFPLASDAETEMLHREAWTNYGSLQLGYSGTQLEQYVNGQVETYYPAKQSEYVYVDWRKELFRTAVTQNYELSVSGGDEKTRFFLSGSYNKNEAVTKGRFFDRISANMNFEHKVNKYIAVGVGLQYSYTDQAGHQEGGAAYDNPWWAAMSFLTWRWPAYNADGTYWTGFDGGKNAYDLNNSSYRNPLLNNATQITTSAQTRLLMKPWLEVDIIDGLKAKTIFGYDGIYIHDKFGWLPDHANGHAYGGDGFLAVKKHEYSKLVSSSTLNYSKTFASDHNLSAMIGWEAEKQSNYHDYMGKNDMASTKVISMNMLANVYGDVTDYDDESALLSFISSVNYNYKSKYFFAATYRRDGSSRLSEKNRWGDFWSISGSWRIKSEDFMQNINWLDDLRLRISHGISGTLPTYWYYYKPFYSFEAYGNKGSFYISTAHNPELTWEKNASTNIAVESRLFNRFSFSVDFYIKQTKDLLMSGTTSAISGFTSYLRNIGSMKNTGVEIDVNVDIIKTKDITWTAGINWTANKNRITEMSYEGEELLESVYILKKGYSYNQYYTREYAGVNPETGQVQFYRNNKLPDGTYNKEIVNSASNASNILIEGKTGDPKGYGGITTGFRYKNLSVSMLFNYMYGHYVFDQAQDQMSVDGGTSYYRSISKEQLRRWQKPGDITDVPRRMPGDRAGYYNSSRMLMKGDFIRLKSITVSYNLPKNWTKKVSLEDVRIYAAGNNIFAVTDLYFDPELSSSRGFVNRQTPPIRTISFGVELSF